MSQLMCLIRHSWMKWSEAVACYTTISGEKFISNYEQYRQCTRCGLRISRRIS